MDLVEEYYLVYVEVRATDCTFKQPIAVCSTEEKAKLYVYDCQLGDPHVRPYGYRAIAFNPTPYVDWEDLEW